MAIFLTTLLALGFSLGSIATPGGAQASAPSASIGQTGFHTFYTVLYQQGSTGIGVAEGFRLASRSGASTPAASPEITVQGPQAPSGSSSANKHLTITGKVNQRTLDRLRSLKRSPTDAAFYNLDAAASRPVALRRQDRPPDALRTRRQNR
ncbi:hypothetical protein NBCG_00558, partial [Nocardioidaceae bacterium Broad-1]